MRKALKGIQKREELFATYRREEATGPSQPHFSYEVSIMVGEAMQGAGVLHRALKTMVETIDDRKAYGNGVLLVQLGARYVTSGCSYSVKVQWALLFIATTYEQHAVAQAIDFLELPRMHETMGSIWDDLGLTDIRVRDKYIDGLRLLRPVLKSFGTLPEALAQRPDDEPAAVATDLLWEMTRDEYIDELGVMWELQQVQKFALWYLGDTYHEQLGFDTGTTR
jgi:hypothetical protein